MGFFSSLVGLFKGSEAPKEEDEASDCCASGQCVCGESSSMGDLVISEDITTSVLDTTNVTSTTSNTSANVTTTTITDTTSSVSGDTEFELNEGEKDFVESILVSEAAPIEQPKPDVKNEVTAEAQVEESSKEQESLQLEFDLSDTVEEKASVPVGTTSPSEVSTRSKTRKSKAKRGKKRNK